MATHDGIVDHVVLRERIASCNSHMALLKAVPSCSRKK